MSISRAKGLIMAMLSLLPLKLVLLCQPLRRFGITGDLSFAHKIHDLRFKLHNYAGLLQFSALLSCRVYELGLLAD